MQTSDNRQFPPHNPSLFDLRPDLAPRSKDAADDNPSDQTAPTSALQNQLAQARVLSVPEPLASLILLGVKRILTTGRFIRHRGITLIYTPGPVGVGGAYMMNLPNEAAQALAGRQMGRKAIIGYCRIQLVTATEALRRDTPAHGLTDLERALDNYRPGRYAAYLEDPHWLTEPVYSKGRGQLWQPDQETSDQIMQHL